MLLPWTYNNRRSCRTLSRFQHLPCLRPEGNGAFRREYHRKDISYMTQHLFGTRHKGRGYIDDVPFLQYYILGCISFLQEFLQVIDHDIGLICSTPDYYHFALIPVICKTTLFYNGLKEGLRRVVA